MRPMLIRRPQDGGTLLAREIITRLDPGTQFLCGPGETVIVCELADETELVVLGPGRHGVPPELEGNEEPLVVFFVATVPVRVHAEGVLEGHAETPRVEIDATVTIEDPSSAVSVFAHLDDEQPAESFFADELLRAAETAAEANDWSLEQLVEVSESFAAALEAEATDGVSMFGITVAVSRVLVSASPA